MRPGFAAARAFAIVPLRPPGARRQPTDIRRFRVFEFIRSIVPSARGELEITDVNNAYIERAQLQWAELAGFWSDAGTFESLFRTNAYWAQRTTGRPCENFTRYL